MKERVVYFILLIFLFGFYGCGHLQLSKTKDQMLKLVIHEKVSKATRSFFNATYDPHDSRFMSHHEIKQFLKKAKVTTDTLPASLQTALKERRVVGLLVSRFIPYEQKSTQGVPKMLDPTRRMLLQWEMSLDHEHGAGALWFDENTECKGGKKKCMNWEGCTAWESTHGFFDVCEGVLQCPPCRECPTCEPRLPPSPP
jgi:hypothetical protein